MSNHIFPVITESDKKLPLYLTGVGCHYHQEHVIRPEGYPAFQWIQCHQGEGELFIEGNYYPVRPHQGMFLYPNVAHEYHETKEFWNVDWIGFNGFFAGTLAKRFGFEKSGAVFIVNGEVTLAKMRRALKVAQSGDPFKGLECSGIIYELLLDLFKYTSSAGEDSIEQQHSKLRPVVDFIDHNFAGAITLKELADSVNITPQHLCLLFKNIFKIRPFEYLNNVRINKSKELLFSRRELDIKTVAKLVGYDNVSYFCAVFKRIEGISPGQFRKLYGIE
jgi:AraC family transcriptional regulator of arabinose operon